MKRRKVLLRLTGLWMAFVLAVTQLLPGLGLTVQAVEDDVVASGMVGDLSWRIEQYEYYLGYDDSYKLIITGEGDMPTLEELGVENYPWNESNAYLEINIQEGITSIETGAFLNFDREKKWSASVYIPETMKRIESQAITN